MKIADALSKVKRIYIEAAPLIYYVEENTTYVERMDAIIAAIENQTAEAISSVITLTEVITHPLRLGKSQLVREYRDILLHEKYFRLMPVSVEIAEHAANLRARYNLRTPDALHVATALVTNCDAFLTNDLGIKRITELTVLLLDDLEPDERLS